MSQKEKAEKPSGRTLRSCVCLNTSLHQLSAVNGVKAVAPGRWGLCITPAPSITIFPSIASQRLICVARPPRGLCLIIHVIHAPVAPPPDTPSMWHTQHASRLVLCTGGAGEGRRGVDYR